MAESHLLQMSARPSWPKKCGAMASTTLLLLLSPGPQLSGTSIATVLSQDTTIPVQMTNL